MNEETGLAVADGPPNALAIYDPGDDDVIEVEAREVGRDELLRGYDDETRRLVDAKEIEVADADAEEKAAKAEAKAAKEYLEALESELQRLIRNRREGRGKKPEATLFTGAAGEVNLGR